MKAEKSEKGFKPIILTLETEEEANFLWHLLNSPRTMSFKDYAESEETESARQANFFGHSEMWNVLDMVYRPKDEENDP